MGLGPGRRRGVHQGAARPGLVVRVAVEAGQEVAEGDTLNILEAMKMEDELRAPRSGGVLEVKAVPGAQVALGLALVSLK
jgi:biotin carboxyl carrier protein